jgi:hypothetical protein
MKSPSLSAHARPVVIAVGLLAAVTPAPAQTVLFSDNFDTDTTAAWSVNASNAGNVATFFFDYSTVGIPAAPGSGGTTRGLKLEANIPGTGVFSGLSVSPLGQSFAGDYTLRFHAWQNFNGPPPAGGNGSTQMTGGGIGTDGTTAQFPGTSVQGVLFSASGEGGTATDYRAYTNSGAPLAPASGAYAAGTAADAQNNSNPYYAGFGGVSAPAAQVALFPQQAGTTAAGTLGLAWHQWEVTKTGNTVTWRVDGTLLATVDVTNEPFGGSNVFLAQFDINATSSTDANARSLLAGVIDNVEVLTPVPEPGSVLLAAGAVLAAGGWVRGQFRRRLRRDHTLARA